MSSYSNLADAPSRGQLQQLVLLGFEDVSILACSALEQTVAIMRKKWGRGLTAPSCPKDKKFMICSERRPSNKRMPCMTLYYSFSDLRRTNKVSCTSCCFGPRRMAWWVSSTHRCCFSPPSTPSLPLTRPQPRGLTAPSCPKDKKLCDLQGTAIKV